MINRRWLILEKFVVIVFGFYVPLIDRLYGDGDSPITVQLAIPDVCIKFQNPRLCSSCEIFDDHIHIHYIGDRKMVK